MPGPFEEIPSKIVGLLGEMNLQVRLPAHWIHRYRGESCWDCGDPDGKVEATISLKRAPLPEGDDATGPTESALIYADSMERIIKRDHRDGIVDRVPISSGTVLRAGHDFESDGAWRRGRSWYVFEGFSNCVIIFGVFLKADLPLEDPVEFDKLTGFFDAQVDVGVANGFVPRDDGTGDEAPLRDLDMDGVVTLRLPANWLLDERDGRWYCYDRGGEPGRMWAQYILFKTRHALADAPPGDDPAARIAEMHLQHWRRDGVKLLSQAVERAPLGAILHIVEDDDGPLPPDTEPDGDSVPLRNHYWHYVIAGPRRGVLASFVLMIPLPRADDPQMERLRDLVEGEVRALRLGDAGQG